MQSTSKEWKLVWTWQGVLMQLCGSAAIGKMASVGYHANWLAAALWFLAFVWFLHACNSLREASLKYFDDRSGTFEPRFSEHSRRQIFFVFTAVAIVFVVVGLLVQIYVG
jgi:hypothetical protein